MDFPEELTYSKEHIWVRIENGVAIIGVTDFLQEEVGLIVSLELPSEGDEIEQDDSFGSIEGIKTVAELYAPLAGKVKAVNSEALDRPEFINDDPYDNGWLLEVFFDDSEDPVKDLMSAEEYAEYVESRD